MQPLDAWLEKANTWLESRWSVALLVVVLFAAALRLVPVASHVPSLDEQWHLNLSTGRGSFAKVVPEQVLAVPPRLTSLEGAPSVFAVPTHLQGVMHPPLYLVSLRLWRELTGDGDSSAVTFSVMWSLLALLLTMAAARASFGPLTALLIGLVLAAAPTQVWVADQVRGYAMLLALSAALVFVASRLVEVGVTPVRAGGFAALMLAAMLTHYFAVGLCLALSLYVLLGVEKSQRLKVAGALVMAGVLYVALWGRAVLEQVAEVGPLADAWLVSPDQTVVDSLLHVAVFPLRAIRDQAQTPVPLLLVSGLLYLGAIALAVRERRFRVWVWALCASPLFLFMLDTARHTRHLGFIRYGTPSLLAVAVVLVALVAHASRGASALVAVLLTAVCVASGQTVDLNAPRYDPMTAIIAGAKADPNLPIVFENGGGPPWQATGMLMDATRNPATQNRPMAWIQKEASPALQAQLAGKSFWIVGVKTKDAPERLFPGTVRTRSILSHKGRLYEALLEWPKPTDGTEPTPQVAPAPAP